jgi:hypothetical protein
MHRLKPNKAFLRTGLGVSGCIKHPDLSHFLRTAAFVGTGTRFKIIFYSKSRIRETGKSKIQLPKKRLMQKMPPKTEALEESPWRRGAVDNAFASVTEDPGSNPARV